MTDIQAPLPSPGVGARRKNPKTLPRLPLSAFSPPNSGTSDRFPLPPSPSTIHPTLVIDGHVSVKDGGWKSEVGRSDPRKIDGIVLALPADSQQAAIDQITQNHAVKILSVVVPINLDQGPPSHVPKFADNISVSLSVPFVENTPQLVEGLKWALDRGYVVDIDVRAPVNANGEGWEGLEELLAEVLGSGDNQRAVPNGAIILSNILPPPHDLSISIVKLLNHPTYRAYQSNTAALSLFPSVFVKYIPPHWGTPTPSTPRGATSQDASDTSQDSKEKKEWKRRIKMYLGPAVEAFGYQRIIYGSASPASGSDSSDWYEIARESLAELGVDQEGVDAVFGTNATTVYHA